MSRVKRSAKIWDVYFKDVRTSLEHSNQSVDAGGSNNGMSSINEQEIVRDFEAHELLGRSIDDCTDEEFASILSSILKNIMASSQISFLFAVARDW